MADQEVGKVIHYYDKAMVAVVKLAKPLRLGDSVKIAKGDEALEMAVESMQLDHKPINEGKAGEEVAIKVPGPTKEGALVTKAETA
jgi:hypothetical protein